MNNFKEIEELPGYKIGPKGEIISKRLDRPMRWKNNKRNYLWIKVSINFEERHVAQHQIVFRYYNDDYKLFNNSKYVIHHKDSNTLNNDINNLELVTQRKNCSIERTIKSGLPTGVIYHKIKKSNNFQSRITIKGKIYHLGCFPTAELAHLKYLEVLDNYNNYNIIPEQINKIREANNIRGIYFRKSKATWMAKYLIGKGKAFYIGDFKTKEEAIKAQKEYILTLDQIKEIVEYFNKK